MLVVDTGKGFYIDVVKQSDRAATGVGLNNVNGRIKIWHGENYGIQVIRKDKGTRIRIIQPLMQKGEYVYDSGNDN